MELLILGTRILAGTAAIAGVGGGLIVAALLLWALPDTWQRTRARANDYDYLNTERYWKLQEYGGFVLYYIFFSLVATGFIGAGFAYGSLLLK